MSTFKTKNGLELPLLDLKGKEYLQVAHRVLWFRTENPLGRIESEPVEMSDTHSIFKATISLPDASGNYVKLADGYKREDAKHFADHVEKSSTGAIGRALALCGYGTQFAPEFDEGERIVDTPTVTKPKSAKPAAAPAKPTKSDVEVCDCGNNMMVSKYGPEPRPWYCGKCKATRAR